PPLRCDPAAARAACGCGCVGCGLGAVHSRADPAGAERIHCHHLAWHPVRSPAAVGPLHHL
ncbi:hypothetical protein HaLaN_32603, partial [Haematococcus lacustris]